MPRLYSLVASAAPLFAVLACADLPTATAVRPVTARAAFNDVDNNPTADGYFIQGTAPELCFWGHNWNVQYNDTDADWVDDGCEYAIAGRFAPMMRFHSGNDNCPGWQPYWAAKAFSDPRRMRIAYMPAYYRDCGPEGHDGDSEMVTVEIIHDPASNHWMVNATWTSAHYRASKFGISDDRSKWKAWYETEYYDRYRGRPIIWVAPQKHANYHSVAGCIQGEYFYETDCDPDYTWDRPFPVHAERNTGSRSRDLLGCVNRIDGMGERCERFYSYLAFNGWYAAAPDAGGGMPYYDILVSDKFELYKDPAGQTDDWGPDAGTPPPPSPNLNVQIIGPSEIGAGNGCQWYASVTGGNPTAYQWTVNGQPAGNSESLWYTNGGSDFEIGVAVQSDNGSGGVFLYVSIVEGAYCT